MPLEIMQECSNFKEPERRRSARLSPPQASVTSDNKMAPAFVQRRITVRKIAPRKTTLAPSEHDKENTPKRAVSEGVQEKKQKICTPENVPGRKSSSGKKKKPTMPSPILPSPPPPLTTQTPKSQTPKSQNLQLQTNQEDPVWSNKVRRSYSRLSDKSFNSPNSRETLFGFAKLQTPPVIRKVGQNKSNLEGSLSALASFTSLLEAEDCDVEPDLNIPGVAMVKEKKKRKKVQQIASSELDKLAAKMNAEFDEAEEFELVVE